MTGVKPNFEFLLLDTLVDSYSFGVLHDLDLHVSVKLVACTAFGVNDKSASKGKYLAFDFYIKSFNSGLCALVYRKGEIF